MLYAAYLFPIFISTLYGLKDKRTSFEMYTSTYWKTNICSMYILYTWTAVSFESSKAAPLMCFRNVCLLLRVACLHRYVIFAILPLLNIIIFVYMKTVLPHGTPRFCRQIKRDLLTSHGNVLGDVWLGQDHQSLCPGFKGFRLRTKSEWRSVFVFGRGSSTSTVRYGRK